MVRSSFASGIWAGRRRPARFCSQFREDIIITLDDILAPLGRERFLAEYYRKKPVHLPASQGRRGIFSLDDLNMILSQAAHWNDRNLRMWTDRTPISAEQYSSQTLTQTGLVRRPDPVKVEALFARGATLVLNETEELTAPLRDIAGCLEAAFVGNASANVYCSPGGRQAFNSHYDDHEVFAFHVAGEKLWRVYEGRIDNPVGQPSPRPNLQQLHDQSKGKVLFEQLMKPGDLMYLPRGQYHDALASSGLSLHVTFSLFPMNGLALFNLLEQASIRDSLFRDDLPNPETPGGMVQLRKRLSELSARLASLIETESFANQVAAAQRERVRRRHHARLSAPEDGKH